MSPVNPSFIASSSVARFIAPSTVGVPTTSSRQQFEQLFVRPRLRPPSSLTAPTSERRCTPRAQCPSEAPDYSNGFDPSTDTDYDEVRPFSFGPSRDGCSLLTLRATHEGPQAFKMSVTPQQAAAIRRALFPQRGGGARAAWERPSTHDVCHSLMAATGAIVTQAAITHIRDEVFVARVWVRGADGEQHVDARPSDAIALAVRARAPLFLNRRLLRQWGVPVASLMVDAKHGLCEVVAVGDDAKSARSMHEEARRRPEMLKLAMLKMRLDLAVRLQRFGEASRINDEIRNVCPLDFLKGELQRAVGEERFKDAVRLQDEITLWKARLRMWERGVIDLDGGHKETK